MDALRQDRLEGGGVVEVRQLKGAPKPSGFHLRVAAVGSGVVKASAVERGDVPAGVAFSAQSGESSGLPLLQEMQIKVISRLVEEGEKWLQKESDAYEDMHKKIVKVKKSIQRRWKSIGELSRLVVICEIDKRLFSSLEELNKRIHEMELACIKGRRRIAVAEQSLADIKSKYEIRMNSVYFGAKKLILEGIENEFAEGDRPCHTIEGWAASKRELSDIIKHYESLRKVESAITVLEEESAHKAAEKCKVYCAKYRVYIENGRRAEMFAKFESKVAAVVNPLQHLFQHWEEK